MPEIVAVWLMSIYELALNQQQIEYHEKPKVLHVVEEKEKEPNPIVSPGDPDYDWNWCMYLDGWVTSNVNQCEAKPYDRKTHQPTKII